MSNDGPPVAARLGALVADRSAPVSAAAIERAKVSILHNLAVALAARRIETVAHRIAIRTGPFPAEAMLLATGGRCNMEAAAFANAALIHARSQDDTHAPSSSHPGAPTLAAALAVGEATGASGRDLLEAVVLGYEALGRLGSDIDEALTGRGYRAASVLGVFGAAAATARLLGLSPEACGHALGLASHMSGGLAQVWHEGSAEGPLQLGFAARAGVFAARAAEAGATAAMAAFEGPRGLFGAMAGIRPAVAPRAPDEPWQIEEATIKAYPACAILQGPLERLAGWLAEGGDAASVSRAELQLSPYEAAYPGIDNAGPFASPTATKLSAQFCLGAMLEEGRLTRADLERVDAPAFVAASRRVAVAVDPGLLPRQSRIRLEAPAGTIHLEQLTPVGRPGLAEAADMALGMGPEAGIDRRRMQAWIGIVSRLEVEAGLRPFVDALAATVLPPT